MNESRPSHDEVVDATEEVARSMRPQSVPVNAYETKGAFVIIAPLPAVTASDVTVELSSDQVRFWAELRSAGPREFTIHEWEYGGYERAVDLPEGYRHDIEATLTNGQLVVRVLSGEFVEQREVTPSAG